jgi:hypothetical protein
MVSVAVVLGVIIAIYDGEGIGEGHLTEDQYGRRFARHGELVRADRGMSVRRYP